MAAQETSPPAGSVPPPPHRIRRARGAGFVFMLAAGLTLATLVVRTPAIRDLIRASTAEMGLVLFGLSVGSMAGIVSSPAVVRAVGARRVVALGSA